MITHLHQCKWAVLTFLLIAFFMRLGFWQLDRAQQKTMLLQSFQERMQHPPLQARDLHAVIDYRFYPVQLHGSFDNEHTILLDNKIHHGRVGYQVYTPFKVEGLKQTILVDRGWIASGASRATLPTLPAFTENNLLTGILNNPPAFVSLGEMLENKDTHWPLRIQFIDLASLSILMNDNIFPYVVQLAAQHPAALAVEWRMVTMSPEKHQGYAVQWFALALTLLILFITLNRRKTH